MYVHISDRLFRLRQDEVYSKLKEKIRTQLGASWFLLSTLYTHSCDLPQMENATVTTFTDDTELY